MQQWHQSLHWQSSSCSSKWIKFQLWMNCPLKSDDRSVFVWLALIDTIMSTCSFSKSFSLTVRRCFIRIALLCSFNAWNSGCVERLGRKQEISAAPTFPGSLFHVPSPRRGILRPVLRTAKSFIPLSSTWTTKRQREYKAVDERGLQHQHCCSDMRRIHFL